MERLMRYFKNSPDAFISSWCPRNPLLSPVQTRSAFISLRVSWSVCPTALNSGLRACEEAAAVAWGCVCVGERVTRRVSANRVSLTSCSLDREEMKSLQAALQKQLDEANEKAEKQQATVRRRCRHLTDRNRRPPPV